MKTLCIPFLASDPRQYDPEWAELGFGTEAVVFDREAVLDPDIWGTVRRTVRDVALSRRHPAMTFHFPVNDCDFVADPAVRDRLWQAIDLVADCGLDGMVLHSNRLRSPAQWRMLDVPGERARFADFIGTLREKIAGEHFWVGLENMPIMGNDATDLDPLLVFPEDFAGIPQDNVGITWDFCHFSYSVHVAHLLSHRLLPDREDYQGVREAGYMDFLGIADQIVHYHFSAFKGVAVRGSEQCLEGMAPWESTVAEEVYQQAFAGVLASKRAQTVTLEIRENNYHNRSKVFEVARWCQDLMDRNGSPA